MHKHRDKKNKPKSGKSSPKHERSGKKIQQIISWDRAIIELLDTTRRTLSVKQIATALGIPKGLERHKLEQLLLLLTSEAKIIETESGLYKSAAKDLIVTGTVDYVHPEYAFIVVEGMSEDIWVHTDRLMHALDGDTVKVRLFANSRRNRPEGDVVEIVKRNKTEFVGKLKMHKRYAIVVCNSRRMHVDIVVDLEDLNGAQDGEKVIAQITAWDRYDDNPVGKIVRVLGAAGENDTEIHAVMAEFGLPFEFPAEVETAADQLPKHISAEVIAKRRDFRDVTTFTIDPFNAKDFDDALSIRQLENGNWEIGVHIADVTHYVLPGSILEDEARKRATSVYLVDRTIPMLPEVLSNNLCSLRPNEDKLTFAAVFELNEQAELVNEWFGRTVIHSNRRFTYEEAQERLETNEGDYAAEINTLNRLGKTLRDQRFAQGAISFESVEFVFELDQHAKPLRMVPKVRKDAHKLIEEFMLLANKRVAEFVYQRFKPNPLGTMVYRIHDDPDPEKVQIFARFAKKFGYTIKTQGKALAKSLNRLSQDVEGRPEQNIIENQAVRVMSKARYTTEPLGHYGLAFVHYTHFTSPIRRYPDMMSHRILQTCLNGHTETQRTDYEERCKHASQMERRAAEAERASVKYKQTEYMQQFIGEEMDGIISGLAEHGMYVELKETRCEGMVRLGDMKDDFYVYDPENQQLVGKRLGLTYNLGDSVRVRIKATDIDRRTIDLQLLS